MKALILIPILLLVACNTMTKDEPEIQQVAQDAVSEVVQDVIAAATKKAAPKTVIQVPPPGVSK